MYLLCVSYRKLRGVPGILSEEGYDIQPNRRFNADVGFFLTRSDETRSSQWLMMSLGDETPIAVL